jgi:hypothetical protein
MTVLLLQFSLSAPSIKCRAATNPRPNRHRNMNLLDRMLHFHVIHANASG